MTMIMITIHSKILLFIGISLTLSFFIYTDNHRHHGGYDYDPSLE